jgi:hypothetical protein
LNQDEKLKIYDSGIEIQPEDERRTLVPSYRIGDVLSPRIRAHEPLAAVVEHFRRVIAGEEASLLSGQHGLQIVRLLEQTQVALDASLARVNCGHASSTVARSRMGSSTMRNRGEPATSARFSRRPVEKSSSTTVTVSPSAISRSTRLET